MTKANRQSSDNWLWAITVLGLLCIPCQLVWAAKPKDKEAKAEAKAEAAQQEAAQQEAAQKDGAAATTISGPPLPGDLNDASLRLRALDTMYELDLSVDQLKALRQAATGAASTQHRSAAKGSAKLVSVMRDFQAALLAGKDANQIDKLRTQMSDLTDDESVQIDDDVQITAAARSKAPEVLRQFTASQLAAWLASHADEVGDPVEMMMSTVEELRDQRTDAAAEKEAAAGDAAIKTSGGTTAGGTKTQAKEKDATDEDAATLVRVTAIDVADAVAGLDEAKAKALAGDVAKWIKTTSEMKDDDFTAQRKTLEAAAKTLTGNVHPMRVLNNWLERHVAELLANPQLPQAIDAIIQAREQTNDTPAAQ
jgi:hypothetical protein